MQRPNSLAHQHHQQQQQQSQQQQQQSQQHRHHQRHHYQRQSSHQNMNNNNNNMNNNNNDYNIHMPSNWIVNDDTLRDVPNFYPLEKSSKFIKDHPSHIANRISECCRAMSVQACFDNDLATADLKTSEHVEIHISLWKSPDENDDEKVNANGDENTDESADTDTDTNTNTPITIVEAQRRKGDAVTYHKYCRNILAAAVGSFSFQDYIHQSNLEEVIKLERQQSLIEEIQKEKQKKKFQFLELQKQNKSKDHGGGDHGDIGNLKDDNEHDDKGDSMGTSMGMGMSMGMSMNSSFLPEGEDSLLALEIAASLLKKDRMDARQLGMETLCLLTDPAKTGIDTALLTSKVVLFGSVDAGNDDIDFGGAGGTGHDDDDDDDDDYMPAEDLGVREAILSLVQFGRLGEYIDFEEEEEEHDGAGGGTGTGGADLHPEEKDFNALLHNLALVVLANALDVLEQHGREMAIVGSKHHTPNAVAAAAISRAELSASQAESATTNATNFLQETKEISKRELLATLLNVLGNAESKPHDACLSAQCLKSLFQASKKAKRRARDLNAKQIVNTALDVGRRTHVKLEIETRNIIRELEKTDDLNDNGDNGNGNQEDDSENEDSD